jgi:hypothetical protein
VQLRGNAVHGVTDSSSRHYPTISGHRKGHRLQDETRNPDSEVLILATLQYGIASAYGEVHRGSSTAPTSSSTLSTDPKRLVHHPTSSSRTALRHSGTSLCHIGIVRIGQAFRPSTAPHTRTLRPSRALHRIEHAPQQVSQSAVTECLTGGSSSSVAPWE